MQVAITFCASVDVIPFEYEHRQTNEIRMDKVFNNQLIFPYLQYVCWFVNSL